MKNLSKLLVLAVLFSLFAMSCSKEEDFDNSVREKFLVDKIYNYNNKLLAEYIYDVNNNLIRKVVADTLIEPNRTIYRKWENELIYQNGRVSKIIYHSWYRDGDFGDYTESQYESDVFEYNSQGKLIKAGNSDFRYKDGYVVGTYDYTWGSKNYKDELVYDSRNVKKRISKGPKLNNFGEPIQGTMATDKRFYEYDNNPKPNFGLDYLFVYNPFPYTETTGAELMRNLSINNIMKAEAEGSTWVYTYNENGLPATIETKWIGITTLEPMLLRITYKEIE